jgi:hypothetical protein
LAEFCIPYFLEIWKFFKNDKIPLSLDYLNRNMMLKNKHIFSACKNVILKRK